MKGGTELDASRLRRKWVVRKWGLWGVDHLIKKRTVKASIKTWHSSLRGSLNYYRFHDVDILTGINTFH